MMLLNSPVRICYVWILFVIAVSSMVIQASDLAQDPAPRILSRRVREREPEYSPPTLPTRKQCVGKVRKDWPSIKVTTPNNWTNEAIKVLNSVRQEFGQNLGLVQNDKVCKIAQLCTSTYFDPEDPFSDQYPFAAQTSDTYLECLCTVADNYLNLDMISAALDSKDNSPGTWINHIIFSVLNENMDHYDHPENLEGLKRYAKKNYKRLLSDSDTKFVCPALAKSTTGEYRFRIYGMVVYGAEKKMEENNSETSEPESGSTLCGLNPAIFVLLVTLILTKLANTVTGRT